MVYIRICVPPSEFDESSLFEESELPANERVVVWVEVGGDERSAVVAVDSESFDVFPSDGREIFDPEVGLFEFGDGFLWNFHLG